MGMIELQERARSRYAESISLDSDEFLEMILLDVCIIVELFPNNKPDSLQDPNDSMIVLSNYFG